MTRGGGNFGTLRRAPVARLQVLFSLAALLIANIVAAADNSDEDHEIARRYSTCAAFYFNGTQAVPMSEYEKYYSAGETAFNEASRLVGRQQADRLAGDASLEMKSAIDGDWLRFDELEQTYAVTCADLVRAVGEG